MTGCVTLAQTPVRNCLLKHIAVQEDEIGAFVLLVDIELIEADGAHLADIIEHAERTAVQYLPIAILAADRETEALFILQFVAFYLDAGVHQHDVPMT